MSRRKRDEVFKESVQEAFSFLLDEGFFGPEFHEFGAYFYSPSISFEVMFDLKHRDVITLARATIDDRDVQAELSCLYVESGIGPAQDVGRASRTSYAVRKSIFEQAEATRRVLPKLKGESRDKLLLACVGR